MKCQQKNIKLFWVYRGFQYLNVMLSSYTEIWIIIIRTRCAVQNYIDFEVFYVFIYKFQGYFLQNDLIKRVHQIWPIMSRRRCYFDIVDIAMWTMYTRYCVNICLYRCTILLTSSISSTSRCERCIHDIVVNIVYIDVLSCLHRLT